MLKDIAMKKYNDKSPTIYGTEFPTEEFLSLQERKKSFFERNFQDTVKTSESLMRFMSRQNLAKLKCYIDAFEMTKNVSGSIVECGVFHGNGLMTWAKLSAALEPFNYNCKIIGFDTFSGNTELTEKDKPENNQYPHKKLHGYQSESYEDIQENIEIFDMDRPINHIEKVKLVKGDIAETAPKYLQENPHTIVRLLSLSMNLYEPTLSALKSFLPRMPKGSMVFVFSVNLDIYPGITASIMDELGLNNIELITPSFYPSVSYFRIK